MPLAHALVGRDDDRSHAQREASTHSWAQRARALQGLGDTAGAVAAAAAASRHEATSQAAG